MKDSKGKIIKRETRGGKTLRNVSKEVGAYGEAWKVYKLGTSAPSDPNRHFDL